MKEKNTENPPSERIDTTIGELICAIADAAREVSLDEVELKFLTQEVLADLLKRAA